MGVEWLHARTTTGVELKVLASLVAVAWKNILANAIPRTFDFLLAGD